MEHKNFSGFWEKFEYDVNNNLIYQENSKGKIEKNKIS